MQNRIIVLTIILMVISFKRLSAQCDNLSISMPDTVCAGDVFVATNTSTITGSVEWNSCFGDLMTQAAGVSIQNIGTLSNPQQIKVIKDNGNYFLFVANQSGNNIVRLDYGTSLANTPVAYNYGNFGSLITTPTGLDVINDNGIWYALVTSNSNSNLVRIDLGADIDANIATAANIGSPGNIIGTRLKILNAAGTFYVFAFGTNMNRFSFGTSMANSPSTTSGVNGSMMTGIPSFDIVYDCKLDKYIGAFMSVGTAKVWVADFGSTLTLSPTFPVEIPQPSGIGLKIFRDGSSWHILSTASGSASKLFNYKFGQNLLSTPQTVYADTVASLNNPRFIDFIEDSSTVYGFASTISPSNINKFRFANPCGPGVGYSNNPASVSITAGTGGYQYVDLSVTDASGTHYLYTDSLFVNPTPASNFSNGPACDGNAVDFNDISTVPAGSITNWTWDFGDGSPVSNAQSPSHIFPSAGNYNVTLTTQSGQNCPSNTIVLPVTISPIPVPAFNYTAQNCQGYIVAFDDNSAAPAGTSNTGWLWTFSDDNSTDSLANSVHVFDSVGVYDITLIVTNDAGCKDSLTQSIDIVATPEPGFSVTSTCVGETVQFNNSSTIQGGGTLTYSWDFGDSGSSSNEDPSHQYASTTGNYDVSLIAVSTFGCMDTIIQNIRIGEKPVPQFTWSPLVVCQGNQITFSNSSSGSGTDTISAYLWNFGDLNTSSLENPTHVYADTGYYNVTLTAISPSYCDSSLTLQVYVIPGPEITFSAASVCLTNSTSFNPVIITPPGTVVDSVVWDFGDGVTFNGLNSPVHTYSAFGSYEVTVTVYNDLLCTSTFIDSVVVHPLPIAEFNNSLPCSGDTIFFDGTQSQVPGNNITSWIWDFNGLGTANDSTPEFTFPAAGTYDITLIVNSAFGCSDTVQNQVSVIESPDFTLAYTEPCLGTVAGFTYVSNTVPTPPSNLIWNFGDGTISFALSPTYLYSNYGTYPVSLTVTNPNTGCSAIQSSSLTVKPNPTPGFSVQNNCEDLPVQLTDTSSVPVGSVVSWLWDFGTLGTSTDQNPSFISTTPGTFAVTLAVTTNEGCTDSYSASAQVYPKPEAAFITDPVFGSPPLNVNFINNTTGGSTYFWEFGDGNTSVSDEPNHIYADTGNYVITMIATSDKGCIDTTFSTVSVLIPYLDIAVLDVFATVQNGNVSLTARIANTGNIIINKTDLRGIIQGSRPVGETRTGTLLPGQVALYQFVSSIQMDDNFIPSYYCIEATHVNDTIDMNQSNNKLCGTFTSEFEIFSAYPQPFGDHLTVSFNLPESDIFSVNLYDLTGRLIKSELPVNGKKGFNTYRFDTYGISKGIYIVSIISGDNIKSMKVIHN